MKTFSSTLACQLIFALGCASALAQTTPSSSGDSAPEEGGGSYTYTDEYDEGAQPLATTDDGTANMHVVQEGDTLWDISQGYFQDPWRWPKVWALNPSITNPHLIYPGDVVKLRAGEEPMMQANPQVPARTPAAAPLRESGVDLAQVAFVDTDKLASAGVITGSSEARVLLSPGDDVFIDYPEGKPPQIGRRYSIYSKLKPIANPHTKQNVGSYVALKGMVEILSVQKGRRARARVLQANDPIERDQFVGPLKTQIRQVAPVAATTSVSGTILGVIGPEEMAGQGHLVFLDRGASHGVKAGNVFHVVRQGDAYVPRAMIGDGVGLVDPAYPEDRVATILVVEVSKEASIGLLTGSSQEAEVGDRVVMRARKR